MRKTIPYIVLAVAAPLLGLGAASVQADPPEPAIVQADMAQPPVARSSEVLIPLEPTETSLSPRAAQVLSALEGWTRGAKHTADLVPWVSAMDGVCMSRGECIWMAAQAFEETGFVDWAVDQRCNDPAWRAEHQMQRVCDHGRAYGPWQVQDSKFLGASPELQASVTLAKMRAHPELWTTWQKARARADRWLAAHPQ